MSNFSTCRSCGCQIMWIRTKAGKNMPVNPQFMSYRRAADGEKANEKIVTPSGDVVSANIVDHTEAEGYGYISHFATCPGAANHRKR